MNRPTRTRIAIVATLVMCAAALTPAPLALAKDPSVSGVIAVDGTGVAVSADGAYLYAASWDPDGVRIISAQDQQILELVTFQAFSPLTNMAPFALAPSPDGTRLFASIPFNGSVGVIDLVSREAVQVIPVGANPRDLAMSPDGSRLYVAHQGTDGTLVSVIDTRTTEVTATIGRGSLMPEEGPHGLAVTPDGRRLYVTRSGYGRSGGVLVIDTATNEAITTIAPPSAWEEPGGWQPVDIAFNSTGTRAYVAAGGPKHSLAIVDTATNSIVGSRKADSLGLDIVVSSSVGNVVYAAAHQGYPLFWTSTTSRTTRQSVSISGGRHEDMAVSPDGRRLYVIGDLGLTVMDAGLRSVTFRSNGGRGTMPTQIANLPASLEANAFVRRGYTFKGWNTRANGTGVSYRDRATVSFAGNLVLHAQWRKTAQP